MNDIIKIFFRTALRFKSMLNNYPLRKVLKNCILSFVETKSIALVCVHKENEETNGISNTKSIVLGDLVCTAF